MVPTLFGALKRASAIGATTTWSPTAKGSNIALSSGNRIATGVGGGGGSGTFSNVQLTTTRNSGKLYLEVTNINTTGQTGGVPGIAFVSPSFSLNTFPENGGGYTALVYGELRSDSNTIVSAAYPLWLSGSQVLQVAVDLGSARKAWVRTVGSSNWNAGGGADPATGTGGFTLGTSPSSPGSDVTMCAILYADPISFLLNCGQSAFSGSVPSGFSAWG